jgi:putative SOS response-associated peptidase YedK
MCATVSAKAGESKRRTLIAPALLAKVVGPYPLWLDPDVTDLGAIRGILNPYDANLMRKYPVSRKLNNSRIDDAESASPVILETPTQAKLF